METNVQYTLLYSIDIFNTLEYIIIGPRRKINLYENKHNIYFYKIINWLNILIYLLPLSFFLTSTRIIKKSDYALGITDYLRKLYVTFILCQAETSASRRVSILYHLSQGICSKVEKYKLDWS